MIDPLVLVVFFIIAIVGIASNSLPVVALSIALCVLMARDFVVHFLVALAVIYGARFLITDVQTWAAISIAIAAITLALTGREKRQKEEEEVPPEMIPYLLALMQEGKR